MGITPSDASEPALELPGTVCDDETHLVDTAPLKDVHVGCVVLLDGEVVCTTDYQNIHCEPKDRGYVQVVGGGGFACARRPNGKVDCWGSNSLGALQVGRATFAHIEAGESNACGVTTDGKVRCWGYVISSEWVKWPKTPFGDGYIDAAAGAHHACWLDDEGRADCWHADPYGVGGGDFRPPDDEFVDITAGGGDTCGLRSDGSVVCWGAHEEVAEEVPEERFVEVAVTVGHACGIVEDSHLVRCWGAYDLDVPKGVKFRHIVAGIYSYCGIRMEDGLRECWY